MQANAQARFLERHLGALELKSEFRKALHQTFADPDQIPALFTDDYVQTTNGSTSDRKEFEAHIRHVAHVVQSLDFEVLAVVQQGNNFADRHLVHLVYQDGRRAAIEVFLFGEVFEGRLRRVHEVTRVLSGDKSLHDLGTAREE